MKSTKATREPKREPTLNGEVIVPPAFEAREFDSLADVGPFYVAFIEPNGRTWADVDPGAVEAVEGDKIHLPNVPVFKGNIGTAVFLVAARVYCGHLVGPDHVARAWARYVRDFAVGSTMLLVDFSRVEPGPGWFRVTLDARRWEKLTGDGFNQIQRQAHAQVEEWNENHEPGVPVLYQPDVHSSPVATRTTSEAWAMSGDTPVVSLEDVPVLVDLAHVKAEPMATVKQLKNEIQGGSYGD